MEKYKNLLHAIRAQFPKAKDIEIRITTTNEERIYFATTLAEYIKDTCCVMVADQIDIPVEGDVNIQFDTTGKICVSTDESRTG